MPPSDRYSGNGYRDLYSACISARQNGSPVPLLIAPYVGGGPIARGSASTNSSANNQIV